jgi:hypothetical protein
MHAVAIAAAVVRGMHMAVGDIHACIGSTTYHIMPGEVERMPAAEDVRPVAVLVSRTLPHVHPNAFDKHFFPILVGQDAVVPGRRCCCNPCSSAVLHGDVYMQMQHID